ncbi:tRNA-dihydrouridine synthase [Arthroderma uncinatum]|uniref:tRNA-dihydrouridine synthase n=1 Tax=Arthroderma uncinatum TaxID=74035 RepID=UPI00144AEA81|nr:tRNA-dihydrouridine synthase [Arthroderma uncinatum]KAF3481094.1 tRNA-dihydrouridine synthase [Arthroderma uncinatum]
MTPPATMAGADANDIQSAPKEIMEAVNEMKPKLTKKKLHGREFYESIGSPSMILAPMVDRSEFAWRMLSRSFTDPKSSSPLLAYSPMLHARLFNESPGYRSQHFEPTRQVKGDGESSDTKVEPYLDGNPKFDRPLIVQFCANDPDELLNAARHVEEHCDAVDLNLGCPQGIAKKGHYGAFLQEDQELIYKLINKLHTELSIPVTAKFRILETKEKTLEYAKMILSAGASIISVHGRRREQKGHNTGVADWEYIRYLRDNLPPQTVIFANGNILNHEDISDCLESTGADGVMSAEGNLSDPTIFSTPPLPGSEGTMYWRGRDGKGGYRLDYILRQYLDLTYKYVLEQEPPERAPLYNPNDPVSKASDQYEEAEEDELEQPPKKKQKQRARTKRPTSPNLTVMQGHLFQLLRHLITHRTDIRDALARCGVGNMAQFEKVVKLVDQAVKQGMLEYENNPDWQHVARPSKPDVVKSDESKATMEKYQRPWWVCQPFIRPLPEEALQIGSLQLKKKDRPAEDTGPADAKADMSDMAESGEKQNGNGTDTPQSAAGAGKKRKITITPDPLVSG